MGRIKSWKSCSKQAQITESMAADDLMQISSYRQPDLVVTGHDFIVAYIDKL